MDKNILANFSQFKLLLIENKLFEEKNLNDLLDKCDSNDTTNQLTTIITDIELRDRKDIESFAQIILSSDLVTEELETPSEETDSSLISLTNQWVIRFKDLLTIPKLSDEPFSVKSANKVKSNKYGDVYPMTSHPRGFCIIIDNQLFAGNTLPFRTGSRNDAYRLADVFSQLLFDVKLYTNKTSVEMKTLLQDVIAKNNELVSHDALAIIILSHGVKDEIYGTDGLTVSVDTIIGYFNNKNCPLLINKPKMFFLSACRGSQIDSGIKKSLNSSPRPMGSLGVAASVMPTWSDIFVYYSTIEGYASLRNVSTGSWFGYELANCLAEFAYREHLHDLVTIKVAERLHERISEMNGSTIKQAIETQTKGFVKKLYFNPGFCAIEKK